MNTPKEQAQTIAWLKHLYPEMSDDLVINNDVYHIMTLPDNLTINGNLTIRDRKLKNLPENLTVNGFLNIAVTDIDEIPESLSANTIRLGLRAIKGTQRYIISDRIGSRSGVTIYDKKTNMVTCGCFFGTFKEFIDRVNKVHRVGWGTTYHIEYTQFINYINQNHVL